MLKILLGLTLLLGDIYASEQKQSNILASNNDGSASFLRNQKYVCVNVGALIDDKMVKVMSQEDAMKYPTRFYVNDENILITDKGMRGYYSQVTNGYMLSNDETSGWTLNVVSEQEKYLIHIKTLENKSVAFVYNCTWTKNWTLAK